MKQRRPFTVEAVIMWFSSVHSPTIMFYLWRITIDDYGTTSAGMITKRNIFHFVDVTEPHVCFCFCEEQCALSLLNKLRV